RREYRPLHTAVCWAGFAYFSGSTAYTVVCTAVVPRRSNHHAQPRGTPQTAHYTTPPLAVPCGHRICCKTCAGRVSESATLQTQSTCPLCRKEILMMIEIFE
ncbi:E3 ubiquitin-protein ligase SPL2, partial [Frankliniella fusca]